MRLQGLYTIPLEYPFLEILAKSLLKGENFDPISLAETTLFLPTRRSIREFKKVLLATSQYPSIILPKMIALGEVSEEELGLIGLDQIKEISPLKRQALLANLVQAFRGNGYDLSMTQSFKLASNLMELIDQVTLEDLDFNSLQHIVREEFSEHWQITLSFLEIITNEWPKILEEEGETEGSQARKSAVNALIASWEHGQPERSMIIAGSTGSMKLTRTLMKAILSLPNGAVILPGFNQSYYETALAYTTHPLHTVSVTAKVCGQPVRDLVEKTNTSNSVSLVLEALEPEIRRPSKTLSLENVCRLDCKNEWEEANTVALILREALEDKDKTSLLVTPDRTLARRVAAILKRWEIDVDDSSGKPLSETPAGIFARCALEFIVNSRDSAKLLALVKNPLFKMGYEVPVLRKLIEDLELGHLRVPYLQGGIWREENFPFSTQELEQFYEGFQEEFQDLIPCGEDDFGLNDFIGKLKQFIARVTDSTPQSNLEDLNKFLDNLEEASPCFGKVKGEEIPSLLTLLMSGVSIRAKRPTHPRISILGPLESRLIMADRVVLAGLNEGTWPLVPETGPWLSRPMREDFGLQPLEQRIGLSAHDFTRAFAAREVFLTRSTKVQGTPTLPCRWLLRIETLLDDSFPSIKGQQYLNWAERLDKPDSTIRLSPPRPRPLLKHRPKQLSVTQVETWMRDPYALYARQILKLNKVSPLCPEPSVADRGTLIHKCLERYKAEGKSNLQDLLQIGAEEFNSGNVSPVITEFWWPRFIKIANWFVEEDSKVGISQTLTETKGSYDLGGFTISAKADRIDLHSQKATIIDYKTGSTPSDVEVKLGYACQLPLEGLILKNKGFGVVAKQVDLQYWSVTGREKVGEVKSLKNSEELISAAETGLKNLVAKFSNVETPYQSQPRPEWKLAYSDYDHLARTQEWGQG